MSGGKGRLPRQVPAASITNYDDIEPTEPDMSAECAACKCRIPLESARSWWIPDYTASDGVLIMAKVVFCSQDHADRAASWWAA